MPRDLCEGSPPVPPHLTGLWDRGRGYVAGLELHSALNVARGLDAASLASTIGWFGPPAHDTCTAERNTRTYCAIASSLRQTPSDTWLEVGLTHLGPGPDFRRCLDRLRLIAAELPPGRFIQVGAEDSRSTDAVIEIVLEAAAAGVPIRATVQANLHRSVADLELLVESGVPVRLVKGGFSEPRGIAYSYGPDTDRALRWLIMVAAEEHGEFTVASHDPAVQEWVAGIVPTPTVEVLLGVRAEESCWLSSRGRRLRVFVPFGTEWMGYVAQRMMDAERARVQS